MGFRCKIKQISQSICFGFLALALVLSQGQSAQAGSLAKGLPRVRSAKIASHHGQSLTALAAEGLLANGYKDKRTAANAETGKYEIRSVSGEPNYKSVNLTWEVEFVPAAYDAVTNSSSEVEPPKAFQVFFCEMQSFGPHRCRSKLVNESLHMGQNDNNAVETTEVVGEASSRKVRHYAVQIENLRMATKYSFHIRPQLKRRNMKITGRSEIFNNEVDDEINANSFGGETIIIPTKGFAAEATKCLPQASEIEVETGPYFGGKIVVDSGNCGVKGNPDDPRDKYTMRIDHKTCGSLVKPETNTVETFITVQENLGIFTHSTRRFVVVCSFQSGMQTVRASFTVPGKDGVAAPVENDPFEPDDRIGREQRYMRYVDKSALVLKENNGKTPAEQMASEESEAVVKEVADPVLTNTELDTPDAVAMLEDIVPGVNERHIKHENEVIKSEYEAPTIPEAHARLANYAKLMEDRLMHDDSNEFYEEKAYASSLHYLSAHLASVVLTTTVTVILLGIFVFVICRELRRQQFVNTKGSVQSRQPKPHKNLRQKPLPRALQQKHQGTM